MKENEIRPRPLLDEFMRLLAEDVGNFFSNDPRAEIACPACDGEGARAFEKSGFAYAECPRCMTLYASPRPARAAFDRFYRESSSARYWATTFYRETEAARREKLWKPKARQIKEKVAAFGTVDEVVDVGGGYGAFAAEIREITDWRVVIIEPSPHLAGVCRERGFPVIEKFLEDVERKELSDKRKCFVSFELFEHLVTPSAFLLSLSRLMDRGDLFIFSTLSGMGVDIQVLWENSKAVSPPQHLNFFNPMSIRQLLSKTGFETLEVTTPGKLDLDIIENDLQFVSDRFWRSYLATATEKDKEAFQALLSAQGRSSHMLVVCRKA